MFEGKIEGGIKSRLKEASYAVDSRQYCWREISTSKINVLEYSLKLSCYMTG